MKSFQFIFTLQKRFKRRLPFTKYFHRPNGEKRFFESVFGQIQPRSSSSTSFTIIIVKNYGILKDHKPVNFYSISVQFQGDTYKQKHYS